MSGCGPTRRRWFVIGSLVVEVVGEVIVHTKSGLFDGRRGETRNSGDELNILRWRLGHWGILQLH